jgi:riboflavin kinase / FMN adenylyltransferase
MELVRGSKRVRPDRRGSSVVIGNLDGVHLGHRALIDAARVHTLERGSRLTVLTFEPHPREFLAPGEAPARLMRLREKVPALRAQGVERLVVMRFDEALQQFTPERFMQELLVDALGATHVVVGHGFRFGARQAGDVEMLRRFGHAQGFEVVAIDPVLHQGERVSSTRIRAALAAGDFAAAAGLLGRAYRMTGRVVAGQQLGRTLGFPTANLRLHRAKSPLAGIFAVRVWGIGPDARPGVASLGTRPTVGGQEPLLEVHVFDYSGNLYGTRLDVEFVAKLRDEAKFPSLETMMTQMHDDARRAREILDTEDR